ncbi:glutamate-1-semialdehyde-2,1-aminomutase [Paenibacillus vortex V453]|jgi:glutamate-1-semialdehyde 2,1-aminomutase|uniref:Glutamate-1-semialdehyde 2,1-aminomutase n=1 Tax=Paenibacillus vortex V453 TaxID=715225 RepID=A0A2R9SYW0_9BACL|nr:MULTISPECIES: glutamate-1-semialdehyde 2,1-aminomutase [Paenibacillus]ANA81408.1 glutamate-1-semialdehyde aminotransferase [Paenibacillus glucanolyticus]AVV59862.1 glutamate-1-semialdehyde-2,1-aminomutase [Paenibacillus glucanolyticus]EFU42531.1 glutamate-1-semialdehyde-2,1-aminomutase [Paenibacillus vortex V453]ETT35647.1 glutamate-1-semialdehyde-2,1-aminomutase [Paenibacillus sp. FSL R5-808]MPY20455.1 glutamate-1-semialdehyde-2,1-aminomutase [Paenibacillus glucanolyticus]
MSQDFRKEDLSRSAFEEAKQYIPGGVNSPVRAFKSVGLTPIYIERGEGSRVYDIDGNSFIDYVGSWGPLIMGHAHPEVVDALQETAAKGTSFGAPTLLETEMAKLVCERVPSIEVVRMVNSGTEATMSAIRLARGYTGRSKIIKFEGSYHGHADSLLIKAGSGIATLGLPDSPGVPESVAVSTIAVPYNDLESVQLAFERFGEEIAAVIVEPVAGNMGVVPPLPGFLEGLRKVTSDYGSVLIFDEVMTGFRVDLNCAQGRYGVTPDLTCLGKVIGGGLPVGAYGGKRELMDQIAPAGPIYQAGTLSGNPLAMAAGYTTLKLLTPAVYEQLEERGARLQAGLESNAKEFGIPLSVNRIGSMVCPFFTNTPVVNFDTAKTSDLDMFRRYFAAMVQEGVSVPPSQFEGMFISAAHTVEDIDATIEANRSAFKSL